MLTLHLLGGGKEGLADSTLSIGMLAPGSAGADLTVYDFGLRMTRSLPAEDVVALATTDPAGASFAGRPTYVSAVRAAANKKVIQFPRRREREEAPRGFVTGYTEYARPAALFWREHAVGPQPLLAAGVFALSSIQTPIASALRLFVALTPYVIDNHLPSIKRLTNLVERSGAGLDSPQTGRPRWYLEYEAFRHAIVMWIENGERDDELRYQLAVERPLPLGLGLAKLSFTLALVGQNLGCLDARIIKWAFTDKTGAAFTRRVTRKRPNGSVSPEVYADYRSAELRILTETPFFDEDDPVGLARSQWMLWESLGPVEARTHTHEELFAAVQDPRVLMALG